MRNALDALATSLGDFARRLRDIVRPRPELRDEVLRANLHRLMIVCAVGVPVSAAHVLLFWLYAPQPDTAQSTWRNGIIAAHTVLVALECAFLLLGYGLLSRTPRRRWPLYAMEYGAVGIILIAGAAITAVDQLVTPNITPFLVVSVLLAVIFIMPPLPAAMIYAVGFVLFYWAIGLVRTDPAVLLSNRLNGLTAAGLGFSLAVMLWATYLRRVAQQDRISAQQRRLEALARVDPLTGALNRRPFQEAVATETARLERSGGHACLLLMDMDHFKAINDRLGHPVGDAVLRFVAELLQHNLRRYDVLARWGGEEFIMLLPDTTLEAGREVAEKLREAIAGAAFDTGDHSLKLTATFGLVALAPGEGGFGAAYARADGALYAAKRAGRNRVLTDHEPGA